MLWGSTPKETGRLGPGTFRWPCPASPSCSTPLCTAGPPWWWTPRWGSVVTRRRCSRPTPSSRSSAWTAIRTHWRSPAAGSRPTRTGCTSCTAVYDRITEVLAELGLRRVDGVLFDLGVSSLQLDADERGFSYSRDADLDMRMDPTTGPTAAEVLNSYPVPALARILREYGEERFAGRIAAAVGRRREREPFRRSSELVELLYESVPAASRRTGGHPAKRTFQALRIEVNGELDALSTALPAAVDALALGGRIVVLAYHSLEDRIVKRELAARATSTSPVDLPVELPGHGPELRLLVRGSEQAGGDEIADNPRAASVRLRAAERIRDAA